MKIFAVAFAVLAFASVVFGLPEPEPSKGLFLQEGKCPDIPVVDNFVPEKFMGKWYSFKQFNPHETPCITYELTQPTPTSVKSVMLPRGIVVELEKVKSDDDSKGYKITNKQIPFYYEGDLRVFATDYETYGATLICKELGDKHQTFAFLWSRTQEISEKAVEIYNEFVQKYSLDSSIALDVKQTDCEIKA